MRPHTCFAASTRIYIYIYICRSFHVILAAPAGREVDLICEAYEVQALAGLDLDAIVENYVLSSLMQGVRLGQILRSCEGIGPFEIPSSSSALKVRVRTDGVNITWTPMGMDTLAGPAETWPIGSVNRTSEF